MMTGWMDSTKIDIMNQQDLPLCLDDARSMEELLLLCTVLLRRPLENQETDCSNILFTKMSLHGKRDWRFGFCPIILLMEGYVLLRREGDRRNYAAD